MYVKVKSNFLIKNVQKSSIYLDTNINGEVVNVKESVDININGEVVNVKESVDSDFYYCYDYDCYLSKEYCIELDKYRDNLISDIVDVE